MNRLKRFLLVALLLSVFAVAAFADQDLNTRTALISLTTADTAGVLLDIPNPSQTIKIHKILYFYDNAANTNPLYLGIVTATAGQTPVLWFGKAMTSSGISFDEINYINYRVAASTAQAGIRLFISAASSDSLEALVEYNIIPR